MNTGKIVVGVAVVGLTLAFVARKKAVGLLNYIINGIGIRMEGISPILRLDIGIQNPSNQDFVIKSFVGNLVANGYTIGNVSYFGNIAVKNNSQTIVPIYIRLSYIGITSDIVNLVTTGNGVSQIVTFKGTVNASGIVAPVELTYKIF